ncbi:hypothetical protein [Bacteroides graminisolvens]|uniref:hypothetical protein n=1 Tax=Bacteroides graminisolvens TaxID=477666 RepID=UPI0029C77C33|nr:hypothetical protein [Bacteroides graminisolvens]
MKYTQYAGCAASLFIGYRKNHTHTLLMLFSLLFLPSCSSKEGLHFQDSNEAINAYSNLLHRIRLYDQASTDLIVDLAHEWRTVSDSVFACINRDSINNKNYHAKSAYDVINDSIIIEFERLIDGSSHNFKDYYHVLDKLSNQKLPREVEDLVVSAHVFFHSMDSMAIQPVDKRHTIQIYENTLNSALAQGIRSKQDILHFLKSEDIAFRLFLGHLSSWGDISLTNIKTQTEQQVKSIFDSSSRQRPIMSKTEIVVLMTMRNNRRLLQNAATCVTDVHKLSFKDSNQATAYLWMLLQPWLSIDGFSYTLLSQEEKESLEKLAAEMPQSFSKLESGRFPIDLNELPALLMKAYIDNL